MEWELEVGWEEFEVVGLRFRVLGRWEIKRTFAARWDSDVVSAICRFWTAIDSDAGRPEGGTPNLLAARRRQNPQARTPALQGLSSYWGNSFYSEQYK